MPDKSRLTAAQINLLALIGFLVVAVLQSWPLPLHLATRLTGPPSGDTGAYVWNTWVFSHELLTDHRLPLSTLMVLPLDGMTDLSLHNYTIFADLLALPLQPLFGVVATFNLIYLFNVALAGFGMFLLAKHVTGRPVESWIAGALFACSPFLVARSMGHFSLAAAAPLPFFLLFFDRMWRTHRVRDAMFSGAAVAWAACCDPYYAVYCVMLGTGIAAGRLLTVQQRTVEASDRRLIRVIANVGIAVWSSLVVTVHFIGGGAVRVGSVSIGMRTLYTPVLILTVLVLVRLWCATRVRIGVQRIVLSLTAVRAGAFATLALVVLMAPQLYALGLRALQGQMVSAPVLWRSSAPGVDALAFLIPNPNHPFTPRWLVDWITGGPGGYVENVASLSIVALAVVLLARFRAGFRPSRMWMAIAVGFGLVSLGPFVTIAGVETYIPTPWTLLRYVPGVSEARMPPRFAVVAVLAFCVLFAQALVALLHRYPQRRRVLLAMVAVLLTAELLPAPRTLYSAEIPNIYRTIAADPRPISVLNLPFGIRDGLSSLGNFSAESEFFQTAHGKRLVGGYLSRVSESTKEFYCRLPTVSAMIALSENRQPPEADLAAARRGAGDFLRRTRLGYVVIDSDHVDPDLRTFAIDALGLTHVATEGGRELWAVSRTRPRR